MAKFADRYELQIDTKGAQNALKGLKTALIAVGTAIVTKNIIDITARFEDLQTTLKSVTGSIEGSKAAFDFIQDFATKTQFGVEELTKTFIQLKANGLEPTARLLTLFTDTAAVTTDQLGALEAMTKLFSRAAAGAGIQVEDLDILAERGIPVYKILAERIGVTRDELTEFGKTANGTNIILNALQAGLEESFGGATADRAQNLSTILSNFKIAVTNLAYEFGTGLAPAIKEITTGITQFVAANDGIARTIGTVLGDALLKVKDLILEILDSIGLLQEGGLQEFAASITASLAQFLEGFGAGIDGIVNTIQGAMAGLARAIHAISRIPGVGFDAVFMAAGRTRDEYIAKTEEALEAAKQRLTELGGDGFQLFPSDEVRVVRGEIDALTRLLEQLQDKNTVILEQMEQNFDGASQAMVPLIENLKETSEELNNQAQAAREAAAAIHEVDPPLAAAAAAAQEAAEAARQEAQQRQVIVDLVAQERATLESNFDSINKSTSELLAQYNHRTRLIGLSEKDAELAEQRYNLEIQLASALAPLQERLIALQALNTDASREQIAVVEEAIARTREHYAAIQEQLNAAIELRYQEIQLQKEQQSIDEARATAAQELAGIQERLKQAQENAQLAGLSGLERQLKQIELTELRAARAARERVEAQLESGVDASVIQAELAKIDQAAQESIRAQQDIIEQQYRQQREFSTGWKNAFEEYRDEATNAAKVAERVFNKTTRGMEDAIVNFAKTGKFEFKDLVATILEELLRSQIQRLIAQTFGMFGAGGGTTGATSLFGGFFANGGTLPAGKFGIVGEAGPELITGPANITPLNNFGSGSVTYNINAVDAASFKSLVARDPGFIHAVAQQGSRKIPTRR